MSDLCVDCGFSKKEHAYNRACYGLCGEFKPMTDDTLVARLRHDAREMARINHFVESEEKTLSWAAADKIEQLEAEVTALRGALEYADERLQFGLDANESIGVVNNACEQAHERIKAALKPEALKGKNDAE